MSGKNGRQYYTVPVGFSDFHIHTRYVNLKMVGDGSFGVVASALDTKTQRKVAIKKVQLNSVDIKSVLREVKLLAHFNAHDNIISLYDLMSPMHRKDQFDDIYIVTSFMDRDLSRVINSKQPLSEQHIQYILFQILRGLKFLHSANVIHRDLKPSNVLINGNCDVALCDLGLARGIDATCDDLTEYVVTRWYRPPELLLRCAHYGKPVDVWSVGCIFAELILRKVLFRGDTPQHQLRLIVELIGLPAGEDLHFVDSAEGLKEILSFSNHTPTEPAPFATTATTDTSATLSASSEELVVTISTPPPTPLSESTPLAVHTLPTLFPPHSHPLAMHLLNSMLQFCPAKRVVVEEALSHPYLKDFHAHWSEPSCPKVFDFDFERPLQSAATTNKRSTEEIDVEGDMSADSIDSAGSSGSSVGLTDKQARKLLYAEVCKYNTPLPQSLPPEGTDNSKCLSSDTITSSTGTDGGCGGGINNSTSVNTYTTTGTTGSSASSVGIHVSGVGVSTNRGIGIGGVGVGVGVVRVSTAHTDHTTYTSTTISGSTSGDADLSQGNVGKSSSSEGDAGYMSEDLRDENMQFQLD